MKMRVESLENRSLLSVTPADFVNSVYSTFLGRTADSNGLSSFSSQIHNNEDYLSVATSIEQSAEGYDKLINSLYTSILGRSADSAGLNSFIPQNMASSANRLTLEKTAALIASSPEAMAKAGAGATAYVDFLYSTVLGRSADFTGASGWEKSLRQGASNYEVALGIIQSAEARNRTIDSYYESYLGRAADANGSALDLSFLENGGRNETIIAGILSSAEFISKITPAVQAPNFTSSPITSVTGGTSYNYTATATDPGNNPITYSLVNAPSGATINSTTGAITWVAPYVGNDQAIQFNGTSNYVAIPSSPSLALTSQASISTWVKFNELPSESGHIVHIMGKSEYGNDLDIEADVDNKFYFYIGPGGGSVRVSSQTVIQKGVWYNVTGTYKGSDKFDIFVNGVQEAEMAIPNITRTANNNPFDLGYDVVFTGRAAAVSMDETHIWDTMLTPDEVLASYQGDQTVEAANLVGHYTFNQVGNTVVDTSGSGNNGTLQSLDANLPRYVTSTYPLAAPASLTAAFTVKADDSKGGISTQTFNVLVS